MSTIRDYSDGQWRSIVAAPTAAGLLITLADASGPIGVVKEGMAVTRAMTDGSGDVPEVVASLVAELRSGKVKPELPTLPYTDRNKAKAVLLDTINSAIAAIEATSPGEVQPFKTWLAAIAISVARASKEGGFLGVGGTLVSPEEQAALDELAAALGVPAPAAPTT